MRRMCKRKRHCEASGDLNGTKVRGIFEAGLNIYLRYVHITRTSSAHNRCVGDGGASSASLEAKPAYVGLHQHTSPLPVLIDFGRDGLLANVLLIILLSSEPRVPGHGEEREDYMEKSMASKWWKWR